jgi:predicted GNAT family N-acyltransferase
MKTEFTATDQLTDIQKENLKQLRTAVYPAAVLATLIGKDYAWATPQWSILVWDDEKLVSRVGLVVREISSNGELKTIGGIGGVMTDPERQDKGHATEAMREAVQLFNEEFKVAYALLFCTSRLIEFYKRLRWKPYEGQVFVQQMRGKIEFSANHPMVLDVKEQAPLNGILDLNGLPW